MPAYSYKERFADYVEQGTKNQTIRALRQGRSRHARPGETVYNYYALRTKKCRKLGEGICTLVEKVVISDKGVTVEGKPVTHLNAFAWLDGFRPNGDDVHGAWAEMRAFWGEKIWDGKEWEGVIIHWKPKISQ